MKPAAVYLRVSKDDDSQTVESQRPAVMQMAAGRGYEVAAAHVFEDRMSGAKGRAERPGLAALLDAAARGEFVAVLVWSLDRISRDDTFSGGLLLIGELDRFNVAVLSHQQTWVDTAGPFRGVFVQLSITLGAEWRRNMIEATKRGIAAARKNGTKSGKPHGRPRAETSDALLDAAQEWHRRLGSWRQAARRVEKDGFQNVPSFATLARRCEARTKTAL
jgi:DNA invertase Pin-like site-specific DNA recombinase